MTRKKFDKNNALHFRLVQRSVHDKGGSTDASDRVFAPLNQAAEDKLVNFVGIDLFIFCRER